MARTLYFKNQGRTIDHYHYAHIFTDTATDPNDFRQLDKDCSLYVGVGVPVKQGCTYNDDRSVALDPGVFLRPQCIKTSGVLLESLNISLHDTRESVRVPTE